MLAWGQTRAFSVRTIRTLERIDDTMNRITVGVLRRVGRTEWVSSRRVDAMQIESGPASGERNWFLGVMVLCVVFAAYFFYDGTWGYLAKNRKEARQQLAPFIGDKPIPESLGDKPTKDDYDALISEKADLAAIRKRLGEPFHILAGQNGETIEIYASDYGMMQVPVRFGRVQISRIEWTKWFKTRNEIREQYYWGLVPLLFAVYAGFRAFSAARLRVRLDDSGLTYGRRFIAMDEIKGLDNYSPKGWIDVVYGAGSNQRLRLDNQRVAKFDEIIDGLCQAKSLPDPRGEHENPRAHDNPEEVDNKSA